VTSLAALFPATLEPAAPEAARIAALYWNFLWVCTAVYVLVAVFLLLGLLRRAGTPDRRVSSRAVGAAFVVSALVLFGLLLLSLRAGRAIESDRSASDLDIEVVGHQWWWEIRYPGTRPDEQVTTANEIHVPVGRTVRLKLSSDDVIHSFWVPSLNGKTDLIPGRWNYQTFRASRAGVFHGRCAEFCGYQHAHMAVLVVAQPPEDFRGWLAAQRQPSRPPATDVEKHGLDVFLGSPCILCHTIRGTGASGRKAPDLTHLASRMTIAAATLQNGPAQLGGWISDSQGIKPGNHMPPNSLPGPDLIALISYLGSLR